MNTFNLPVLASVIERRLLVNWRADPEVVGRLLPEPLRPQLANGHAVVGVCLIRLGRLRPTWLPAGLRSENAAHRVSVEWDEDGQIRRGVYIPRRHSSSRLTVTLGGRLFPGVHDRARFDVHESGEALHVAFDAGDVHVEVDLEVSEEWPGAQLFDGLAQASAFFADASSGYSASRDPRRLDGLELRTSRWQVEPTHVRRASSTVLDALPTAVFDHALLMRRIPVTWHAVPGLQVGQITPWTSPTPRPVG